VLDNLNTSVHITIFLDNTRYQKRALVMEKAKSLHTEFCFLPFYSPNLNLIEREWKFMKKECPYSKNYEKYLAFKTAISNCLEETVSTHKSAFDSLLTLGFQLFENVQFVTMKVRSLF
jgi:transposase